jgi:Lrp/AsnC family transcriptional regulator for asnA, asnC and gidA
MGPGRERVDDLDRRLTERLWRDGRESTRSLAKALDISEATVSARLRRLEQEQAMRVVAVTDFDAFGYPILGFACIAVHDRPARVVAQELASVQSAITVAVTTGPSQVMVVVLARDLSDLGDIVGRQISGVDGVAAVQCHLAVEVSKFDSHWAALEAASDGLPTGPAIDDITPLDGAILRTLQRDARTSNRRIADELDINESTVRNRIRRMEDEGMVRIKAIADYLAFGHLATSFIGIRVTGGNVVGVGQALAELTDVAVMARTVGGWDFVLVLAAASRETLLETAFDVIAALPNVRDVGVMEVVTAIKHVFTWAKIGATRS